MRTLYLFIAVLISANTSAQNLNDLENAAHATVGKNRVEQLLSVSGVAFSRNDFDRSLRLAEEAEELARKADAPLLRAKALHYAGKAMMKLPRKKGLFSKRKPEQEFTKSNQILTKAGATNDPLFQQNLALISQANQGTSPDAAEAIPDKMAANAANSRSELKQEVSNLNVELNREKIASDTNRALATRLLAQSKELQSRLADRESALNQMTEGQMKVEFMLLEQRQMLDSLLFRASVDSLMLSNQNLALREANVSRNLSYAIAAVLLMLSGGIAFGFFRARQNSRVLAEKNRIIGAERERSDQLLLNILPLSVAEELKQKGSTNARYHEDVSVLFADFVNFTQIAERITPQQLVTDLDTCFRAFDDIIKRYNLEKIKTIGDAYLCAGGLHDQVAHQTVPMVNAARDMQQWLAQWNTERIRLQLPAYHARIGIHRGAVVAGVVGAQKFAYDIWGDTVNIAARIEQAGEPGRINLSGAAHQALNNQIACNYRGKIPVKNKGEIDMFFVT